MISANDWASPDAGKNIALAEADKLNRELAAGLGIQLSTFWLKTQLGATITEAELRANNYMSPLPVNLYCYIVTGGSQEINIAQFRAQLRQAAVADDPTGTLVGILQQAMPTATNITANFTRIPAIQAVITAALKKL